MTLDLIRLSPEINDRYRRCGDEMCLPLAREAARRFERLGVRGASNDWLLAYEWKRVIAWLMYHDLLAEGSSRDILEIGSGLSGLSFALSLHHRYVAIEKAMHETAETYRRVEMDLGRAIFKLRDWTDEDSSDDLDLVVANDVFPNVDQRLYEFVASYLPRARELRLSLTYYENTAFEVTRESSGERLVIKPWGLREVRRFVSDISTAYDLAIAPTAVDELTYENYEGTLFTNRRNIVLLRIA
jgi:hypothetical protein